MTTVKTTANCAIVPLTVPLADNYNAGMTMESFNMAKFNHATIILQGSDSCAGAGVVTIYGGLTAAATTAAATFTYRIGSADAMSATADVLGDPATSAALTLVEADIKSGMYVFELDVEDLNISGVQYNWVTPVLSAAGTAGIVSAVAILSEPRYASETMATVIT